MFTAFHRVFRKILERLFNKCGVHSEQVRRLVWVAPGELCFRITASLIPPVTAKYKKISVDLVGPTIAVTVLIILLNYGSAFKRTDLPIPPLHVVVLYTIFVPIMCFILNLIGQSWLTFLEVFSLMSYALYGHILALAASHLITEGKNDAFFFICLIIFGGLSTLRMVLLQLQSIPLPGARLLVCTIVSVVHILFLVFLHFTYMHPHFVYGRRAGAKENRNY